MALVHKQDLAAQMPGRRIAEGMVTSNNFRIYGVEMVFGYILHSADHEQRR